MYKYTSEIICSNCGGRGHIYKICKKPKISLGVIAVRYRPKFQILMICRRNTLGYVDFIRGKYELDNPEYIQSLFDNMTTTETNELIQLDFLTLWNNLWQNNKHQYENEYINAQYKYTQLLNGLDIQNTIYSIKYFIENIKMTWSEPEWGFPKGRRNYLENDYNCAIREWSEETGYISSDINIIKNITPYNEIFLGRSLVTSKKNIDLSNSGFTFRDLEEALMNQIQTDLNQRGLRSMDFRNAVTSVQTDEKIKKQSQTYI